MFLRRNKLKSAFSARVKGRTKAPTGIVGFDEITGGGLPSGRATLLVGGPGSGKTILALQFLAHGAQDCGEPGIFVAFEETFKRVVTNAESFGWKLAELQGKKLFFIDAQPAPDLIRSGDFDLSGMLAALEGKIKEMGARRIVFDAMDIVLALLPDLTAQRREIYRLHHWLLAHELTVVITLKAGGDETNPLRYQPLGFIQFMVDCVVILKHGVVEGVSQRDLRVQKYRGSSFDEDESPFVIGKNGFELAVARRRGRVDVKVSDERVSSGVKRLDAMLGGGYFRSATVLITGFSGTAKTTLAGAFAQAACRRGERTLFVSFDSNANEVIRNLAAVGIRLAQYVKSGRLRMVSARTITGSAETYLVRIKALAKEHATRCIVIDPVSTWSSSGHDVAAHSMADRLIDWSKAEGTTLLFTTLLDEISSQKDGSPLQISTAADTWIHLSYLMQAGERNRGLSIIKSRGTSHSNQMRELILSDAGVHLVDTYTASGEVLMGTLRWQKEQAERAANEGAEIAGKLADVGLDAEEAELAAQLKTLQDKLVATRGRKTLLARSTQARAEELSRSRAKMLELRGADVANTRRKTSGK